MILVLDFGSQTTHLIARRIKDLGAPSKILPHNAPLTQILSQKPKGIILSGGPASVYQKNAPGADPKIFQSRLPILGICYGLQFLARELKGNVRKGQKKEYGPAQISLKENLSPLFAGLPQTLPVWMSHQDRVTKLPQGFKVIASTPEVQAAAIADDKRKIYGLQFHPEVSHAPQGLKILGNFLRICKLTPREKNLLSVESLIRGIKNQIGKEQAVCALSGGVDSSVAAVLVNRAIGKRLTCFYIDTGFMRQGETQEIAETFKKHFLLNLRIINASKIFLAKIKGVAGPEKKRKIIGKTFIRVFEKESQKLGNVPFLVQGTIYPDVIESGTQRRPDEQKDQGTEKSAKIKSHHNVGGLPKNHKFQLIEPLKFFYKDEVRQLAEKLGLPQKVIHRQVFPGPGLAIRIIGEVTPKKLRILRQADLIVSDEIRKARLSKDLWMAFAILAGVKTTAVVGDSRLYGETIALRAIESRDAMTADWARLPYPLLGKISSRIVNEVPGVARVVYDITSKPPATMEWE